MTTFTLPTSRRVTQEWGQDFNWLNGRHYPDGFYSSIGWLGHNGIDYGCPEGDEVEAVCDGVIEYVGPGNNHPLLTGGGNALLLRNDDLGIRFEYLHLSQQNVYTGQRVTRGQVIARSGNTGTSTAPHLHLGAIPIRPNLNNGYRGRVDPTGWLYGPSNPDYAGIAAQGTTTTTPEDDFMGGRIDATQAEDIIKAVVERVVTVLNGNIVINPKQAEDIVQATVARINATADGKVINAQQADDIATAAARYAKEQEADK